eukprot:SAG31_NODE_4888_length_2884_cov_1.624776_1_plen_157_part_00
MAARLCTVTQFIVRRGLAQQRHGLVSEIFRDISRCCGMFCRASWPIVGAASSGACGRWLHEPGAISTSSKPKRQTTPGPLPACSGFLQFSSVLACGYHQWTAQANTRSCMTCWVSTLPQRSRKSRKLIASAAWSGKLLYAHQRKQSASGMAFCSRG